MSVQCGIVGLPNVGKSTIFSCLTKLIVAAENYPFCTIDPNVSSVAVPDDRLLRLADIAKSAAIVPSFCDFVDIAGLVAGASKGEGLGNKFLSHVREADALIHVVRCFSDENIVHVNGVVDPVADVQIIQLELVLSDIDVLERYLAKQAKTLKISRQKDALERLELVEFILGQMNADAVLVRNMNLDEDQFEIIRSLNLLTDKPFLYCANVDEPDQSKNEHLAKMSSLAEAEGVELLALNAASEKELIGFSDDERQEFLSYMGFADSGLNRLVKSAYRLLGRHSFFTVGPKETHSWTIPTGTKAQSAAGAIHSDIEKGFIRAETISYEDFISCNGFNGAKESGKMRLEGKEYVVNDGDIIHFRFNV
ncbi:MULTISPECIES: redox-regulated ATPase YchF [Candidatus Ichthyocystis]|uniref:Ribosome-binding ATPase YchF n=1 Tax=Candidatus Ichthyocystis hellenicum TaxID=1561003 RepID=A0A0S4M3L1_9BURK|nr:MULTISPECIES: redox-regulated ATPase YchF [Ichthyocystis]CUT17322.1 GTP-binding protein YchF [Candidatus Ichthyocystis hellenicum]